MRLLLAHEYDAAARQLAARWGSDAVLMTPAELSAERLVLEVDGAGSARAELPSRLEVTSVLTRLSGISGQDLPHIHRQDSAYASAELDAFLRAWLGVWRHPVVNRPSTTCLNGPGWRPEQWSTAAAAAGLRTRPIHRTTTPGAPASPPAAGGPPSVPVRVTAVGACWFGAVREELGNKVCALAEAAGCVTLEVLLEGDVVVAASAWPNVADPDVAGALARFMDGTR